MPEARPVRPWCSKRALLRGILSFALFACLPIVCIQAHAATPGYRLGVAMPSIRESRWQYDLQAIRAQAARMGVEVVFRFADNSQEQQNLQIMEMANLGINALLLVPNDGNAAAPAVDYAKTRGVVVIAYDRPVRDCAPDAYVTFEQTRVGELQGQYLAEHAPTGAYILIYGPKEDGNSAMFREGAMRVLRPLIERGDIQIAAEGEAEGWKPEAAGELVRRGLATGMDIRAVLSPSDVLSGAVVEALSEKDLAEKIPVTGQDATAEAQERIALGLQSMTVFKDTDLLAAKAMRTALQYLRGEPAAPDEELDNGRRKIPTYYVPVMFVDKDSLPWLLRRPEYPR